MSIYYEYYSIGCSFSIYYYIVKQFYKQNCNKWIFLVQNINHDKLKHLG